MDFIGFNEATQPARLPTDVHSVDGAHANAAAVNGGVGSGGGGAAGGVGGGAAAVASDPLDLGDDEHEPQERRGLLAPGPGARAPFRSPGNNSVSDGLINRAGGGGRGSGSSRRPAHHTPSVGDRYWTKIIFWASLGTIVIGLGETVIAFWMSSRAILVLSVSCMILAVCALLAVVLSALAMVAVKDLDSNPATSFAALSFYLNTGLMLCVTLITLGITVMALQPDFVQYVRVHWNDGDDDVAMRWGTHSFLATTTSFTSHSTSAAATAAAASKLAALQTVIGATDEDTDAARAAAQTAAAAAAAKASAVALQAAVDEITAAVHSIGLLAIAMALMLMVSVYSAAYVRPLHMPAFGVQSFLWAHGVIGLWGCALLAVSIYAKYHEWSLSITAGEARVLQALGIMLFAMALFGLYRCYALTEGADITDADFASGWGGLGTGWLLQSQYDVDDRQQPRSTYAERAARAHAAARERRISQRDGTGSGVMTVAALHGTAGSDPIPAVDALGRGGAVGAGDDYEDDGGGAGGRGGGGSGRPSPGPVDVSAWGAFKSWFGVSLHVATLACCTVLLCYCFLVWVYRSVPEHASSFLSHRQWLSDDSHAELQHNPTKLALLLHIKMVLLSVMAILSAAYVSAGAVLAGFLESLVRAERYSISKL